MYLAIILFLCNFVYALLGMNFFANKFDENHLDYQINNFDSFLVSFVTVFNIITLDSWTKIFLIIRDQKFFLAIFSIFWIFIGNFLLLNLFITILLDSFSQYLDKIQENDESIIDKEVTEILTVQKNALKKIEENMVQSLILKRQIAQENEKIHRKPKENFSKLFERNMEFSEVFLVNVKCNASLMIFSKDNIIRKICILFDRSEFFKKIMNTFLVLAIFELILETFSNSFFLNEKSTISFILVGLLFINTIFFSLEAIVKMVSFGFYGDKNSYISDNWNILDLCLIISYYSKIILIYFYQGKNSIAQVFQFQTKYYKINFF